MTNVTCKMWICVLIQRPLLMHYSDFCSNDTTNRLQMGQTEYWNILIHF